MTTLEQMYWDEFGIIVPKGKYRCGEYVALKDGVQMLIAQRHFDFRLYEWMYGVRVNGEDFNMTESCVESAPILAEILL